MDALLIVDMQHASVSGNDKHDIRAVVERINGLAARVRAWGGAVIFIQHDGDAGDGLAPFSAGWQVLDALGPESTDRSVRKTLNDPFAGTTLAAVLGELAVDRVIVAGWATDFCVDATVRSAVSHGFAVAVAADCHTLNDRPHLTAPQVIAHHNWIWANLIAPRGIRVAPANEI